MAAGKVFGCILFAALSVLFAWWAIRDIRRGSTVINGLAVVIPRAEKPLLFWINVGLQIAMAGACLYGGVALAFE